MKRRLRPLKPLELARFWSKVNVTTNTACWPWMGRTSAKGYGEFGIDGRSIRAHRVVWSLVHGDPGESLVLHTCDNPPCCNPAHLFLGSDQVNTDDAVAKRRRRSLTFAQRNSIPKRIHAGHSVAAIARDLGVSYAAVQYHVRKFLDPSKGAPHAHDSHTQRR